MKIRTLATVTSCAALVALIAAGCSSSNSGSAATAAAAAGNCPAAGAAPPCPKDEPITQKTVEDCTKSKNDPKCGTKYVDVLKCLGSNIACGADMKYDAAKGSAACKSQFDLYTTCLTGGAGTDGG